MSIKCTKCNSDQVQTFPMAYQGGVSNIGSPSVGVDGVSVSLIASQISPPHKKTIIMTKWVKIAILFTMPLSFLVLAIIKVNNDKYNAEEWPGLYEEWSKNWLCNKCGNCFKV